MDNYYIIAVSAELLIFYIMIGYKIDSALEARIKKERSSIIDDCVKKIKNEITDTEYRTDK